MSLLINGRIYSRCCCDTSTTSFATNGGTADTSYCQCSYCTSTATGGHTKEQPQEESYNDYEEREEFHQEIMELGRIARRIKYKAIISIISQNVINKTMQRRMMNGRR